MTIEDGFQKIFKTDSNNDALLVQRFLLALVMFPHGSQKVLGWFGGYGFAKTMSFFVDFLHVPSPIGFWSSRESSSARFCWPSASRPGWRHSE